jgi:hypothetical protein
MFTTGPSTLWGLFGSGENVEYRGNFLGYVALALALLGLITRYKQSWFWGITGLVFLILAFGPVLHFSFDPDWTPQSSEGGLTMPGKLLYNLPFGNIARVPLRYSLITMLALAMLAAYGLDWLTKRLTGRPRWKLLAPTLAGLLVFLEFFPGPRSLADTTVPAFYQQLRTEGQWNDFAILETPDGGSASIVSRAMYFQTVHQHPIVGGYLSRKPDYPFRDYPGISELLNLNYRSGTFQRDILDRASLSNTPALLHYYNIRYVMVHPQLLTDEDSRFNAHAILETVFGSGTKPYYQDEQLQVWKVPESFDSAKSGENARILPQLAEGWGQREEDKQGAVTRSVAQQARLILINPYQQPLPVQIRTTVSTGKSDTQLNTLFNGQAVSQKTVSPNPAGLITEVTLKPGVNELVFKTNGPVSFGRFLFIQL